MLFDPFQEVQLGVLQSCFSVTLASEDYFLPVFVSFHICFPAIRDSSASFCHSSFSSSAFPSHCPSFWLSEEERCEPLKKQATLAADSVPGDGEKGHLAL